jgi:putative endonuclease
MKLRRDYNFYVYILSNHDRTCFYIGLSNDIIRRLIEHENGFGSKFTNQYNLKFLIYWENYKYIFDAINREKEIKKWRREKDRFSKSN